MKLVFLFILFSIILPTRLFGIEQFYIYSVYLASGIMFIWTLKIKKDSFGKFELMVIAYGLVSIFGFLIALCVGNIMGRSQSISDFLEVFRWIFAIVVVLSISKQVEKHYTIKIVDRYYYFTFLLGIGTIILFILSKFSITISGIFYNYYYLANNLDISYMLSRPSLFLGNPNSLGVFGAFLLSAGLPLASNYKKKSTLFFIGFIIIIMTLSRTALFGAIAVLIVYYLLFVPKKVKDSFLLFGVIVVLVILLIISPLIFDIPYSDFLNRYVSEFSSLGERSKNWFGLFDLLNQSPFFGLGFTKNDIAVIDNYYLTLWLRGGVILLLAYLFWIISMIFILIMSKKAYTISSKFMVSTILIIILFGVTDLAFGALNDVRLSVLYWSFLGILSGVYNKEKQLIRGRNADEYKFAEVKD